MWFLQVYTYMFYNLKFHVDNNQKDSHHNPQAEHIMAPQWSVQVRQGRSEDELVLALSMWREDR